MSDDKVIHAFPAAEPPENLMTVKPRPAEAPYFCDHAAVRLDAHERTVHCARCNAVLDPFNFLLANARTLQTAWDNHRHTREMVATLNERVEALKKLEKSLRGKVGRLQNKVDVVLDPRAKPE